MFVRLNSLNESLEKKYSLNESILTEAFDPSFPDWLKVGLIRSKQQFGVWDKTANKRKDVDWRNGLHPDYGKDKDNRYQSDADKSLFNNALEKGFFNVTIHEGLPPKGSDFIPIYGFPGDQVYIPGFNDLQKFNIGDVPREQRTDEYMKMEGKTFKYFSAKALKTLSIHQAYFDPKELDTSELKRKELDRETRRKEEREFYKDNKEYARKGTPSAYLTDIGYYNNQAIKYGQGGYGKEAVKLDKSGYVNIPAPIRYKDKLNSVKGKQAAKLLEVYYKDIQTAFRVYKDSLENLNIFDDEYDVISSLQEFKSKIVNCSNEYNRMVQQAEYSDEAAAEVVRDIKASGSYKYLKDFTERFKSLDNADVDWLL